MKVDFEPIGRLTAKKFHHYICIALAIILPIFLIIITLVKKTFSPITLLVCVGIVAVFLIIDLSNRKNTVVWNSEKIALTNMLGHPIYYDWNKLKEVYTGSNSMRLEFTDNKKLYINLEYDGIDEFNSFLSEIYEKNK